MKLAAVEDVLKLAGMSERVGTASSVESALELATAQIENSLGTSLARATRVDYFGFVQNISRDSVYPDHILNLEQSFLDKAEPVEVYFGTQPILSVADSAAEQQNANVFTVDFVYGRVHIFGSLPVNPYRAIAVRYTAGFETDSQGLAMGVPEALRWGAAAVAIRIMRSHGNVPSNKIPFLGMQSELQRSAHLALRNLIRPRMVGESPQFTETV